MDPILLARAQFALTVMFHFVFPSITIGLGLVVAVLEVARIRPPGSGRVSGSEGRPRPRRSGGDQLRPSGPG